MKNTMTTRIIDQIEEGLLLRTTPSRFVNQPTTYSDYCWNLRIEDNGHPGKTGDSSASDTDYGYLIYEGPRPNQIKIKSEVVNYLPCGDVIQRITFAEPGGAERARKIV